jgi:hypothetical protein
VFEEFSGVAGKGLKYVSQKKIMDRRTIREWERKKTFAEGKEELDRVFNELLSYDFDVMTSKECLSIG